MKNASHSYAELSLAALRERLEEAEQAGLDLVAAALRRELQYRRKVAQHA